MLIATIPPADRHQVEIANHPLVDGLRFNTVMPAPWSKAETLRRLQALCANTAGGPKPLWIDLKARQLRITRWADPLYECLELNHRIRVNVPTEICFKGHSAVITAVDGNRLFLEDRPRFALGAGQPVNIHDSSLEIEGFLTGSDREYAAAAKALGIHSYMLSFVEQEADLQELLALDPEAEIVAKIESPKGLAFVEDVYPRLSGQLRLMAARDDLYINIGPDKTAILAAEQSILSHDAGAIAASRILTSLEENEDASLGDLKDLESLFRQGYQALMLSDALCLNRRSFRAAMTTYGQFLTHWRTRHA